MVGTVADGQLTSVASAPPGTSVRFAVATRADDAAIRRLLRENPMRGAVTLTLEREPGYFQGTALAGGEDQTIVAFERDRLLCMGRCTIREAWLNGRAQRVAYLAELRLDATAQGRFDILRRGYRFFHELQRASPADFTFTSIATDNTRARRLLERGLPGLPRYEFLGGLTTLLISTRPRRLFARPKQDVLETTTADELAEFFNRSASCYQLAPIWTPERILRLGTHGLAADSFGVVRTNGRIIAAGALWDQRSFRQTVIRGYSRSLACVRPIVNTLGGLLGFSPLPRAGSVLSHAFLSPFAASPDVASLLPSVVSAFCRRAAAKGIDYLTLGLPSNDLRLTGLRRCFRTRTYASRIYRVRWPGDPACEIDSRPILPDVALL
jgi:hypothetical protein